MPTFKVTSPDGNTYRVNAPDGATEDDAIAYVQKNFYVEKQPESKPVEKPLGAKMNDEISSIPRQLGLTARAGLEGAGDFADFLSTPFRVGLNAMGGDFRTGSAGTFADTLGLPKPETTTEKVVNTGARMMVPGAGFVKGGQVASKLPGVAGDVGTLFASNPMAQLSSAAGGGAAGEYVKQTGGNDAAQFLAALAGGVAAPAGMNFMLTAPKLAGGALRSGIEAFAPGIASKQLPPQVDVVINNTLKSSGLTLDQLPQNVIESIRNDVSAAMKQGDNLNADALRRLIDYRMVGAIPRNANLTLDPVALTQQKNLAKLGANSKDPAAQLLARAENENNAALIGGLNNLGANTADDAYTAAQKVTASLSSTDDAAKGVINRLYDNARNTQGRSANISPSAFAQRANDLLDEALLGGKLPSDVRTLLNKTATGEMPLTVDVAEQFKTRIGQLQRSSNDPAERLALGKVRQALDEAPLLEGQGQQAIDAFNKARRVNAAWMKVVERTPALQAVRDGVEPDKFVNQYIIGNGKDATVMDVAQLKNLVKGNQEAMTTIRGQLTSYLKGQALNGASDEVGNFSQSAFNKALEKVGERKLALFFNNEELAQLKAIGRVASYEQVQPRGSAVNNSNTASAGLAAILDRIGRSPLLSKIPLGTMLAEPAQNIAVGIRSKQATNIPAGLVLPGQRQPMIISPAVGLLGVSE